jgi:hypothetical protein
MFRPSSPASSSFVKNCDRIGSEFDMPNTFALISARSNHIQGFLRTGGFHEFRGRIFPPKVQRRPSIRLQEVGRGLFSNNAIIDSCAGQTSEIVGYPRRKESIHLWMFTCTYELVCSRT